MLRRPVCQLARPPPPVGVDRMSRQRLIVDVDTGIDDSLALLYLLASPEAEILGIASTAGTVPVEQVAANNLNWLALGGAPDTEVALGAREPVVSPLVTTEETHGPQG